MAVIETRRRWRGILALCGGVLVHLALGTSYTFGNMAPYITSYIRDRSKPPGLTYQNAVWIYAANMVAHALTMFFGGVLDKRIGPRKTALLGGFIVSAGVSLTYLSIKSSFYLVIVTYGMMFGAGNGLAYMAPLACAMRVRFCGKSRNIYTDRQSYANLVSLIKECHKAMATRVLQYY
ncbi:apicoplast pyruvate carrier 1-like [Saccoglossus kowalevskii]